MNAKFPIFFWRSGDLWPNPTNASVVTDDETIDDSHFQGAVDSKTKNNEQNQEFLNKKLKMNLQPHQPILSHYPKDKNATRNYC